MRDGANTYATSIAHSVKVSEYSLTAAFLIMIWETIITIGDEVMYIWPKPSKVHIKWAYFLGKYFALALQTAVFWFQLGFVPNNAASLQCCRTYRALEVVGIQLLMVTFDLVLLLRIYALYGRKTVALVIGIFAIVAESVATTVAMSLSIPVISYDSRCMMTDAPENIFIFVVGVFVSQATLLWLAYRKKERFMRATRGGPSAASVTIRDGVCAFLGMFALLVVLLVCELVRTEVMNMLIYWFPVVESIATCRLIINLQHTVQKESTQELTTDIWGLGLPMEFSESYPSEMRPDSSPCRDSHR